MRASQHSREASKLIYQRNKKSKKKVLTEKIQLIADPKSIVSEQIRSVRTSLEFVTEEEDNKVLVITSSEKNAGKTFVSSNLAVAFAQSGKKTLLIDADIRNPSVQRYFPILTSQKKMKKVVKLTNLLEDNIKETYVSNLYVSKMGHFSDRFVDFFSSDLMATAIKALRKQYDQIIIDTPPVLVTSDPLVLASYADGIVLVIRSNKSAKQNVKQTIKRLQQVSTPIIGSILNDVKENKSDYYTYY